MRLSRFFEPVSPMDRHMEEASGDRPLRRSKTSGLEIPS